MKLVSISGIGLSTRVQKSEAGAFELFIGLLIPFSLETGEVIVSEDCNPFSIFEKVRSAYGINYSIDYGYPKASAEYLAFATCYPPARESGPIYISIDIADCCKELAVFGDRKLTALGTFGPPANFNSMPVIPSRAFTGSISETAIPNVEYPDQLCVDANDVPKPAGYWPRALNEPRRLSALGDFDQQWLARRWPHLPTDTEPEFFFSAPKDQRLSGYLVGGESVRIVNMHPDFPLIETTVPRINPCVFVEKTDALGEDVFVQLETRIDTLWLLPDEMVGILLARGSTSCQYSSAKDVKAVYATVKMQDEAPDTLDEHYQQYLVLSGRALQVATPDAVKKQASEPDVLAEATLFAAEPAEVAVTPLAEPEPLSAADQAIIDQLNADRSELDALTAEAQSLMPAGVTEESMRKFMSQFAQRPMTDEKAIAAIKKLSTDFASYLEMTGLDKSKMIEVLKSNPDMEHLASQAAGLPDDLSLLFTDLEQSFNLLIQRNAELKALVEAPKEELSPDVAPETPTEPPLSIHSREWVIAQYEAGKSFAGIELIGLDLSRLNLSGSVFSGATIDDCNLDQTVFKEARLDQLVVTGSSFVGSDLEGANLKGASLSDANCKQANLSRANLEQAYFSKVNLSQATLDGALAKKASFSGSNLSEVSAPGLVADEADFTEAKLVSANLAGSRVKSANFYGADLTEIILSGAYCQRADFSNAIMSQAQVNGAILGDSQANAKTSFDRTNFHKTDLGGVCWMGVQLDGVVFNGCKMEKADFANASLTQCQLINATAQGAVFDNADIVESDLSGINLFEGSLRGAHVRDTKMELGNYYAVDFQDTVLERSSLEGSNIGRTILAIRQALA